MRRNRYSLDKNSFLRTRRFPLAGTATSWLQAFICEESFHQTSLYAVTSGDELARRFWSPADSGSRILNGEPADILNYPFYGLIVSKKKVYLNMANHSMVNVHCGSSLISPKYFLTAFHCFMLKSDPDDWVIIMGLKDRCKSLGSARKYNIVEVIPHPHVVIAFKTKKNDIAIVKVDRSIRNVMPVNLPVSPPRPGDFGEVVGFGLVRIDTPKGSLEDLPCPLQKVTQMVPNQLNCKSPEENIVGAFCVVDADRKNAAACRGDSGGPWIIQRHGSLTIAGVSSFGDNLCKASKHSDHYTNVYRYLSWILDTIEEVNSTTRRPGTLVDGLKSMHRIKTRSLVTKIHPENPKNGKHKKFYSGRKLEDLKLWEDTKRILPLSNMNHYLVDYS